MKSLGLFIPHYIVNLLVLVIFNRIFPQDVVLASAYFGKFVVYLWAPFVLTVLLLLAKQVVDCEKFGKYPMLIASLVSNIIVLWVMARMPGVSSFGITSYVWAVAIGAILATLQWWVWIYLEKSEE